MPTLQEIEVVFSSDQSYGISDKTLGSLNIGINAVLFGTAGGIAADGKEVFYSWIQWPVPHNLDVAPVQIGHYVAGQNCLANRHSFGDGHAVPSGHCGQRAFGFGERHSALLIDPAHKSRAPGFVIPSQFFRILKTHGLKIDIDLRVIIAVGRLFDKRLPFGRQ